MSKTRYFSKSRIKIKPNGKYEISLNRRDYSYYGEIIKYADKASRLLDISHSISIKFSIDRHTGKIKRYKPSCLFLEMSKNSQHYVYK
jgi:hypothetical protein